MIKPSEIRALLDDIGVLTDMRQWEEARRAEDRFDHFLRENAETFARWGEALEDIVDGEYPSTGRKCYRDDGKPSKNDTCVHERFEYEGCADCISEFARKALGENP